jgi:hypothetical protein
MGEAFGCLGLLADAAQNGEEDGNQDGDDANDDEQFDESERLSTGLKACQPTMSIRWCLAHKRSEAVQISDLFQSPVINNAQGDTRSRDFDLTGI